MRITEVEFGSLLAYSPSGNTVDAEQSRTLVNWLKTDHVFNRNPPILTSDWFAELVQKYLDSLPFRDYFNGKAVLVPTPGSGKKQSNGLWIALRLADALFKRGLAREVRPCLERAIPVPKSATSLAANRPKAERHFETMSVQKGFADLNEIVLIDDVITRGATTLGAANRLIEAFPTARIRVFATVRTISSPSAFTGIAMPCVGKVELRGIDCYRRP